MSIIKIELAANPVPRHPAANAEPALPIVQSTAAIAHEQSTRRICEQATERIDAVLQGHRRGSKKGGRESYNPATIAVPGRPGYPDG
jgi:hypothetical protein